MLQQLVSAVLKEQDFTLYTFALSATQKNSRGSRLGLINLIHLSCACKLKIPFSINMHRWIIIAFAVWEFFILMEPQKYVLGWCVQLVEVISLIQYFSVVPSIDSDSSSSAVLKPVWAQASLSLHLM